MTVPAESFDARTANPRRIKEAGFPARPKSGTKAYARWMRAFGHPSPRSIGAPPGPCVLPGTAAAATSFNYTGYRGLDANTDKADEKTDRTPRYRRIAAELIAAIEAGEYPDGSQLPGEAQLAERFGASRNTIRSALGELDGRGLVQVIHGKRRIVGRR